jgi:hypothetical protein
MTDSFDIFECLPAGDLAWRGSCANSEEVHEKLAELAKLSKNEIYAKDSRRRQIVARVNEPGRP